MSAENVDQDTGLLAEEPSHVEDAVIESASLEEAVLDSVAASREQGNDTPTGFTGGVGGRQAEEPGTADADADADDADAAADDDADDADADSEADDADDVDIAAAAAAAAPPTGAISAERLALKALEHRLLGGERKLRRREVAAGAGLSLLSARKLWRALGFPNLGDEDVAFTERDQAALNTVVDLVRSGKLTEEAAISVTRAIGQMTDRMVVWQVEALVEDLVHQQGVPDSVARKRLVSELPSLVDALEEMLVYSWRRQLNAGVQRLAVRAEAGLQSSEEGREGDEDDAPLPLARAVGFADLVSYTSLSRRMNEKTLAQLVQRFENKCAEIISVGGGRLVKTVGDEVLYIAETPAAGAEISLALCQAFTEDEILPQARVAMVWGRILSRLGDIYGPTVNLAARLTALADPGTVLVDSMTAAALGRDERFVLLPRPAEDVRGFGEIHPVKLQRGSGRGLVLD
ncbi:adenylate cyclase [Arthrobacter sp. V4I6]|uniref:adenylate/guanylate cyclase domain-containing protein n=1 Tax=unclassified Arthrobacter TaxID=235627 RepID=UPI00277DE8D5|nr:MULTISPECIES: adenylate/guanylate cyclase domain-containing protein [unclassified Arthrobacter]MDQ0822041.1 adenylate cyclase [Arthrobacter sp. V1I7]MDQ0856310.1 adenylate cyclase [Arthrobacter sp. V4I6]